MDDNIRNLGSKGRLVMWVIIAFILLLILLISVYQMNFELLP